jgi:hypothetical protein
VLFVLSVCILLLSFAHNLSSSTSPSHERELAVTLTGLLRMYANFQCGMCSYISIKLIPSSCIFRQQFWKGLSIYYIHPTYRCGIKHTVDVTLSGIEFCLCNMKDVT